MTWRRGVAALLLLSGFASLGMTPRRTYLEAYDRSTRRLVLYWDVATALILRGTYLTPHYRAVMAEERRRLLGATEDDHQAYVDALRADGASFHEVVFSADSGLEEGTRKFGLGDDGWVLRLEADGTVEDLVSIYRVRRPNPLQRALYPHFNIWSDLWIARFARTVAEPDLVVLHVGSGYGNGALRWEGLR
jgi:hypothetical protein